MTFSDHTKRDTESLIDDEELPVMEPVIAHVSEAPHLSSSLSVVTPDRRAPTDASSSQEHLDSATAKRLTQCILRSEAIDSADFPEGWKNLCSAVAMLQQRASMAADEATTAIADATQTRRHLDAREEQVASQSHQVVQLKKKVDDLQQRNERLTLERKVLKKAYQNLFLHSTVSLERYVETALLQHEEQLGRFRTSSVDSDFEELEHLTTCTTTEPITPANNVDADKNGDESWTSTPTTAVAYTPIRIVPGYGGRSMSNRKRRHIQNRVPLLSIAKDLEEDRSGTPTTTTSDTVATHSPPSTTKSTTFGDPHMFRSLAIPMS